MLSTRDQKLAAEPVDEATKAALEASLAAGLRGETYTMDEVRTYARKRFQEWRKNQQDKLAA